MGVSNGNRPTNQSHRTKIVEVVAQVGGPVTFDVTRRQPLTDHLALVLHAVPHFDTELGSPRLDDTFDLLGHDEQGYANRSQSLDAEPVGTANSYRLPAVLRNGR
jgi:hypothetical protein